MKIKNSYLKQIIQEELEGVLSDVFGHTAERADSPLLPIGIEAPVGRSLEYEETQPAGEEFMPMSKEEMIDADLEAALYPQAFQETDITQGREGMPVRLVQRSREPGTQHVDTLGYREPPNWARARLGWARKGVPHLPGRTDPGGTQVSSAAIHGLDPRTGGLVSKTPGVGRQSSAWLQEIIKEEFSKILAEGRHGL